MHLSPLIQDLAVILVVAAVITLLFRAIRQPVVLGYIVAGFVVGPYFKWAPSVVDSESVKVWAEIGVIFLLFALGLEFSFKKLARVGAPASVTAVIEVMGMVAIGFLIGRAFGWGRMDSLFLGGILAISSTTIIIRAFDELGMKTRGFARLVFGVLIIEDMVAILLMVILSTVAVSRGFSGFEMGASALKLAFFLILWFVLGIFLVPSFLKRARSWLRPETLLIVSSGLCFLMVVLATRAGFSPALGAFVMGSILAETVEAERIEHLIQPVKDLFGAVFFVSVGMLIEPPVLIQYAQPILLITLATIVGKLLTTSIGALLSGQSLRHSVQAGLSLAQIGEFSFIVAGLGLSLKVTSDFLYPIAISVSAVTTFTTPYLIRSADQVVSFLEKRLPRSWQDSMESFRSASTSATKNKEWKLLLRKTVPKAVANGVIVSAVFLVVGGYLDPWFFEQLQESPAAHFLSLGVALIGSSPFLWALTWGRLGDEGIRKAWRERRYSAPLLSSEIGRWVLAVLLYFALCGPLVGAGAVAFLSCLGAGAALFFFSDFLRSVYFWLERRFVSNLHEKERTAQNKELPPLAPWDAHMVQLRVSSESPLVGRKFSELMIRERFGVTIALVQRGRRFITAPGRDEVPYPGDLLQVIGTDDQIHRFKHECEPNETARDPSWDLDYVLHPVFVAKDAYFANKTIRECGLREATQGLVVGIEKQGRRTLNPDSTTVIEPGDVLWMVGNRKLMTEL